MAKAESGLRQRIKKALEADGWSVITQHGSAYNPNVLDLTVVMACLEVKTDNGRPSPGQVNTIRKLRKQGIPAGIVRSVEEARQGMALVRQGARSMPDPEIDLSYLNSLLAGNTAVAESEAPATEPEEQLTIDNLLGMQGQFEEFDPTPALEEPEPTPAARPLVEAYQSVLKQEPVPSELIEHADGLQAVMVPSFQVPTPSGLGVLEQIVGHLAHIDQQLTSFIAGFGGGHSPQHHQTEEPVVRRRRGRPSKQESPDPVE